MIEIRLIIVCFVFYEAEECFEVFLFVFIVL